MVTLSFSAAKKLLTTVSLGLMLGSFSTLALPFAGSRAEAVTGSQFKASNIIDDSIFFNNSSMSAGQVQSFLNAKVPQCDTNGTKMYNGSQTRAQYGASQGVPAPYTCLRDYAQNTPSMPGENYLCNPYGGGYKSAAQIITDVSNICGINPQTLIVLLQKEQSLVTDEWPWPIQYSSATGFGCPDTAPCDSSYGGYFYQVYYAARQFKLYARDVNSYNYRAYRNNNIQYNPNSACGSSTVYLENQATAGLYIYTPYQPNQAALNNLYGTGDACSAYGNRNFWRMFNDWFGPTTGTELVQGSGSTVYLINTAANLRYGVPSVEMLKNYGAANVKVTPVSDSYLNTLGDGGVLGTLFTVEGDSTVYLADGGFKYGIPSGAVCTAWGVDCTAGVRRISFGAANKLRSGGTLSTLMNNNYVIYRLENGLKRPYLSQAAIASEGRDGNEATFIQSAYNALQPTGAPIIQPDTLVKFGNNATFFFYKNGKLFTLGSYSAYIGWFPGVGAYHDTLSSYTNTTPASAGVITQYFRSSDNKVYLINAGKKIDITASASNWPSPLVASDLDPYVATLPLTAVDEPKNTYRTPNGAIFIINSAGKSVILSMEDYYALGYSLSNTINISPDTLDDIPTGIPATGEGSLFKVSGSDTIYLRGPSKSALSISSMPQLGQYRLYQSAYQLPSAALSSLDTPKLLSSFITTDGSTSHKVIDARGNVWDFGASSQNQWGITTAYLGNNANNFSATNNPVKSLPKTNRSLPSFMSYDGSIYYGENGQKRPLSSYNRYLSLGGNESNTFTAAADFANAVPIGPTL